VLFRSVVGGKATLAPQLDTLGLGAFEERDPYGNPVASGIAAPVTDPKKK
jgi:hypothetical protein